MMLSHFVFNYLHKQLGIQHTVRAAINSSLHTGHKLRNLSARESIDLPGSLPEQIITYVLNLYLLPLLFQQ
ncbi:Os02g0706550 [Oryza sativa Japonica Group]|uniref:Os02g0706550 protein n=1 Tax=Oryza sativa subsp. japonica TaxID=39947 RepID=A0A0P0VNZ6_ORYSJ|nr:hypothetical protein EE612_013185 [Oryza sativa]BAS80523.1 Os02g0706550 [Oryza sativa Japonica Group]